MNPESAMNENDLHGESSTPWLAPDIKIAGVGTDSPKLQFTVQCIDRDTSGNPLAVLAFNSGVSQPLFVIEELTTPHTIDPLYQLPPGESLLRFSMHGVDTLLSRKDHHDLGQQVVTFTYGKNPNDVPGGSTIQITIVVEAGTIPDLPIIP